MARIVLLSCTKSKLDKPSQAQDLYSPSPMFQKTKAYGETLKPDKTFILSAKYHLTPMEKELEPYNLTLKDFNKDEKQKWGETVVSQMKEKGIDPQKDTFIFLAGSEYIKPLKDHIPEENIENPMEGKRMGERLSWLNSQVENLKEVFRKLKKRIYEILK
jgi:hypothetical protein|tara:strand:+ start:353 stop:832 length:480 start_codon:yes stop_codon:yes gene_type:complete